jgi:hypothetical protein
MSSAKFAPILTRACKLQQFSERLQAFVISVECGLPVADFFLLFNS